MGEARGQELGRWRLETPEVFSFVSTANEAYTDINNIAMQKALMEGYFCRYAFLLCILYFVNPKKHMSIIWWKKPIAKCSTMVKKTSPWI
jgi:hypothetical protein